MLRLLKLPQVIQKDLIEERLSMGHARVLAGLIEPTEQKQLRDLIIARALSVRQLEDIVKKGKKSGTPEKQADETDHYYKSITDNLKRTLGTKVEIHKKGRQGRIVIHFYSDDELDRLLDLFTG